MAQAAAVAKPPAPPRRRRASATPRRLPYLLITPAALLVLGFTAYPVGRRHADAYACPRDGRVKGRSWPGQAQVMPRPGFRYRSGNASRFRCVMRVDNA